MSKKLSMEEKRTKMLEIFREKKEAFVLKDLEKMASKDKGIVQKTVKDVLTSLVDDDLVDSGKIGPSVYFWSPSIKTFDSKVRRLEELERSIVEVREKNELLKSQVSIREKQALEQESLAKRQAEIEVETAELNAKKTEYEANIARFQDINPDAFDTMKKDLENAKAAVDRWTDNVFTIASYCKKRWSLDEKTINKQLQMPKNFDYFAEPK